MRKTPKLKRTFIEAKEKEASECIEIGSQHLADNESIHGSLHNSEQYVSMVVDQKPEDPQLLEEQICKQQDLATKRVYDKFIKSKRKLKSLTKSDEHQNTYIDKCNLNLDIQQVDSGQVCLDLDAIEMSGLGLLERARLFVGLKQKPSLKAIKNCTRHKSLSMAGLSKSQLLKLCEQDNVQWKNYQLPGAA